MVSQLNSSWRWQVTRRDEAKKGEQSGRIQVMYRLEEILTVGARPGEKPAVNIKYINSVSTTVTIQIWNRRVLILRRFILILTLFIILILPMCSSTMVQLATCCGSDSR